MLPLSIEPIPIVEKSKIWVIGRPDSGEMGIRNGILVVARSSESETNLGLLGYHRRAIKEPMSCACIFNLKVTAKCL